MRKERMGREWERKIKGVEETWGMNRKGSE